LREGTSDSRDYHLILAARTSRAFGFGFSAVLVGIYLERKGLTPTEIGGALAVGLLAASLLSLAFSSASARFGHRACLISAGLFMCVTGVDLAIADNAWLLVLSGLTGMLGTASVDVGPFAPVEQAVLSQAVRSSDRNLAFARYSLAGGLGSAAGGLASAFGTTEGHIRVFFLGYSVIGLATAALAALLSPRFDAPTRSSHLTRAHLRPVAVLSGLFAIDSLGGGFVVPAVIAYWLHIRFGANVGELGPAFAVLSLVGALSFEVSGRLANRIGLIRTMVFTHFPSNVVLILVSLAPSFGWAIALLVVRSSMSQMDVPARQAYIVSIVDPPERAAAVAVTGATRGIAQAAGPILAGLAIQGAALGAPFLIAGGLKIVYDVCLYAGFRGRLGNHEAAGRV
jgi:MFS family permease